MPICDLPELNIEQMKEIMVELDEDSLSETRTPTHQRTPVPAVILVMSFVVCTCETKSGLAWTHTKPTLNPTNTHTNLYKCGEE